MNTTLILLTVGALLATILKHYLLYLEISNDIENERNFNND